MRFELSPREPAAGRRSTGTTCGAAARRRAGRSPRGARESSSRRSCRSPSRGGEPPPCACSGRGVTLASTEAAAIAALRQSPSITARCSNPKSGTLKPSTRQTVPPRATPSRAVRSASRFVLWRPRAVDSAHAARDDHRASGGAQHERVELLARLRGVLLGVVEAGQRAPVGQGQALEVEQHGRRHQRAREPAAAGLVGAGDVAAADVAVEGEQAASAGLAATGGPPGSGADRRGGGRRPRRCSGLIGLGVGTRRLPHAGGDDRTTLGGRRCPAAPTALEQADSAGWPVGDEGLPDDPLLGDGPQ